MLNLVNTLQKCSLLLINALLKSMLNSMTDVFTTQQNIFFYFKILNFEIKKKFYHIKLFLYENIIEDLLFTC